MHRSGHMASACRSINETVNVRMQTLTGYRSTEFSFTYMHMHITQNFVQNMRHRRKNKGEQSDREFWMHEAGAPPSCAALLVVHHDPLYFSDFV